MIMAFDYSTFTTLATDLIGEFGSTVTLRKRTTTVNDANVPSDVTVANTDTSVTAARMWYRASQIDGESIRANDRRYLISAADLSEAPDTSWQIIDDSETFTIIDVKTTAPGSTSVLYDCHARA